MAHKWAEMLHHPCILGDPQIKEDKIKIGLRAAVMLHHPCILGDSQTKGDKIRRGTQVGGNATSPLLLGVLQIQEDKIRIGPQVGGNATSPLHSWGFPNKGGQNQNWSTSGRKCYITPAFSGIPKQRGTKSELAHKWAEMLHHPCILGNSQIKEDKIRIGPQVGGNATSPLHSRGSPNKGEQNQNWATSGR